MKTRSIYHCQSKSIKVIILKKQNTITFLLSISLVLFFYLLAPAYAEAAAKIRIDPANQKVSSGDTFTIDIRAEDVKNLLGWQFDITFDPNMIEFVQINEGQFLQSKGKTLFISGSSKQGAVRNIAASLLGNDGVDGSGIIATAHFKLTKKGSAKLDLENHLFSDPSAHPIVHSAENGGVNLSQEELLDQTEGASGSSAQDTNEDADSLDSKSSKSTAENGSSASSSSNGSNDSSKNDKDSKDKTDENRTNTAKGAWWILVIGVLITVVPLAVLYYLKRRRVKMK